MHTEIRVNFSLLGKELVKIVELNYYIQIPNIQSYDTNVEIVEVSFVRELQHLL